MVWTLGSNLENLTLTGASSINGTGNAANNVITGNAGNNVLDGGAGVDMLIGGAGNDTYVVDSAGDTVTENANEGTDTVQSSIGFALGANVENLTLTGTANINATGNALDNVLTGNSGDNVFVVQNAGDTVIEAASGGTDTVQSSVAWNLGANLENLTLTGAGNINGSGNSLANAITGNAGNNVLDGGAGVDAMAGGAGNDTYVVDSAGDTVTENANEGTDAVQSSIGYTLGANVENLTLTGSASINGTGNALNNVLTGNSGTNVFAGGAGDDTYYVSSGDTVVENPNEGTDQVYSDATFTLGANVENLTLTGSSNINATGNSLANVLTGNSGANAFAGGAGDDAYYVSTGDTVTESANEGTDLLYSDLSYTLGANLENLTLTGAGNINGTGNSLNNVITGNAGSNVLDGGAGADVLDGGAGADQMKGGSGDDTYVVDNAGDAIVEAVTTSTTTYVWQDYGSWTYPWQDHGYWASDGEGGSYWVSNWVQVQVWASNWVQIPYTTTTVSPGDGQDTVLSSISYTLAGGNEKLEHLKLTGTGNINGAGNEFANYILGNSGNNTLTGGAAIDALEGGAGDDSLSDSAGSDAGFQSGGAGNDVLNGGSGREFFSGGAGNDTIHTGDGTDIVAFNRGGGQDSVDSTGAAQDNVLALGGGIRYSDLKFRKTGNDLVLDSGQSESVTLKNWYAGSKPVATLQVIIEASADYNAGSSDATLNKKIERFNFNSLATAFDQALAANPSLTEWALSSALTQFHLGGSDTESLGGDLAYYFGKNGTLATMGFDKAVEVLGASQFGQQTQTVRPWDQLQQGVARLNP